MSDWKNVQYKDGKMRTSEGGGGGGSSTFAGLDDVSFSNLQNGQIAKYNSTTQKWENANESGGGHTYSTTEQVIGTWIDGKPLYEKTFDFTPTSSGYNINISSLNIDTPISVTGMIIQTSGNKVPVPYCTNTTDYGVPYIGDNATKLAVVYAGSYNKAPWYVTIQYTKTTD